MYKKRYKLMAGINLLFGVCAIFLYMPYMLQAFNINVSKWIKAGFDLLGNDYWDIMMYLGIVLLLWIIGLTILSLFSHPNIPKIIFKISVISALALPLIYVLALKYDWALKFWIENLSKNIKMISYILLIVSGGSFVLGLIFNFTKNHTANPHHVIQALVMCVLILLFIVVHGWCGWDVSASLVTKCYGVMMGLFAIYLPISTIILMVCSKKRL